MKTQAVETSQAEKKRRVAQAALKWLPNGGYLGIGTGSTVNCFIEELASHKDRFEGVVATSEQSKQLLLKYGLRVVELNEVQDLPVYFDGADEVNSLLQMIKGAGGALLAEKIVASVSRQFICMVDDSKYVPRLGNVPVPVEVLPYARSMVSRKMVSLGGRPELRIGYVTESGNQIIDVYGLELSEPLAMENQINEIPGVVENGIFAKYPAHLLLIADDEKVELKRIGNL
ncbi:MAG: ribose-5-phosphate isomerase RpiA [Neisseriaceae bacterium]